MTVRIRTIKPELPDDEKLGECSRDARLTYVLLITQSDCKGNQRGKPALIKAKLFPYDDDITARDVAGWIGELELRGLVRLYADDGQDYLHICGWATHQKVSKPGPTSFPEPPAESDSQADPGNAGQTQADPGDAGGSRVGSVPGPGPVPGPTPSAPATPKPEKASKPRKRTARDDLFDALLTVEGIAPGSKLTKNQGSHFGKLAGQLAEVDATPTDVKRRAGSYKSKHPTWDLTASALVKHWGALAPKAALVPSNVVGDLEYANNEWTPPELRTIAVQEWTDEQWSKNEAARQLWRDRRDGLA